METVMDCSSVYTCMNNNNGFEYKKPSNYRHVGVGRLKSKGTAFISDVNANMTHEYTDPGDTFKYSLHDSLTAEDLREEHHRLRTFNNWSPHNNKTPYELVKYGFYSLSDLDKVKCGFCGIVLHRWKKEDDVFCEHRKASGNCSLIKSLILEANHPSFKPTAVKFHQYALVERRLDSFFHQSWPLEKEQKPWELSCAGFFCVGDGDKVKCYVCGGNLKNWDRNDLPMSEHRKWYPNCEFVQFIKKSQDDPYFTVEEASSSSSAHVPYQSHVPHQIGHGAAVVTAAQSNDDINEQVSARMDLPNVQSLLQRGFSQENVRKAIKKQLTLTGDDFPNMTSLMMAVQDIQDNDIYEASSSSPPAGGSSAVNFSFAPPGDSSRHQTIRSRGPSKQSTVEYAGFDEFPTDDTNPRSKSPLTQPATQANVSSYLGQQQPIIPPSMYPPQANINVYPNYTMNQPSYAGAHQLAPGRDQSALLYADPHTQVSFHSHPSIPSQQAPTQQQHQGANSQATIMKDYMSLKKDFDDLQEQGVCKICMDAPCDVVFMPCGHLVTCNACSGNLRLCPICRTPIDRAVKTYKS